jgi:CRISPR/Cas system-associated endonuclease/helicase Cas3
VWKGVGRWWGGKRVLRYQRGNQNPYIEEQTPQRKSTKDKQRSTKHTHKTNYRLPRIPLKTESELMCSKRVSSACSTSNTPCRANPATIPSNQNYVIRQKKNHFISFFLQLVQMSDWRLEDQINYFCFVQVSLFP